MWTTSLAMLGCSWLSYLDRQTLAVLSPVILADTGRTAEAQVALTSLAGAGFQDLPQDGDWLPNAALLGQLATLVEDRESAATLYELLAP